MRCVNHEKKGTRCTMNILITGGAGLIGTSLVRMLVARGEHIVVVDNGAHSVCPPALPGGVRVIKADVRDGDAMAAASDGMDAVIHLAASGSVVQSVQDPVLNFEVNAAGTLNMLEKSRDAGVKKFIFASTGGALIGNADPPVSEESLPRPISPYGAGKLCGEAYCHAFARSYGLPTVALRFANVYGPYSAHKRGATTAFIKALMSDSPIIVYGDGTASRDFLYVEDLCRGIIAALDARLDPGTVLHLASGVETTVGQLARLLAEIAGRPNHPILYAPQRKGEVQRNFASFRRAHQVLGFAPAVSLRDGLSRTWNWFQEQDSRVLWTQETTDA